jgi:predicted nucleic acid-binding protein
VIIDASVILSAFFPDEDQAQAQDLIRAHATGHERLEAPTLLLYEVTNAVLQAIRRARITVETGEAILQAIEKLNIDPRPVAWGQALSLAQRFDRSAYDAAYLALAEATGQQMITADSRLHHAVENQLEWVHWIGEYRPGRTSD